MEAEHAVVAWSDVEDGGQIVTYDIRDEGREYAALDHTRGAVDQWQISAGTTGNLTAAVLALFHWLVVGGGLDPDKVHIAFLAIDEYRDAISPDLRAD